MLVHLFTANPPLHCWLKMQHFPLHKPQLLCRSTPTHMLSSPSCGMTDVHTLKVEHASTQLLCPSVEILSEMRPGQKCKQASDRSTAGGWADCGLRGLGHVGREGWKQYPACSWTTVVITLLVHWWYNRSLNKSHTYVFATCHCFLAKTFVIHE